jgi:hypothetical protein
MSTSRSASWVAIYLALVAVAFYVSTLGKFAGIYLVVLTYPWSVLGVVISDVIDPKLLDDVRVGYAITATGAVLNSLILFRFFRGRRSGGPAVTTTRV